MKRFIPPITSKDNKQELTIGDLRAIEDFRLMVTEKYDASSESIKNCLKDCIICDYTEPEEDSEGQE